MTRLRWVACHILIPHAEGVDRVPARARVRVPDDRPAEYWVETRSGAAAYYDRALVEFPP